MRKIQILKQKQLALLLIIIGVFAFIPIGLFFYFKAVSISGFSQLLPAQHAIGFIEFPTDLSENLGPAFVQKLNKWLGVDWNNDIAKLGEKAAFAVLDSDEDEKVVPFLLIRIEGRGSKTDVVKNFHSAVISDFLVLSTSESALKKFLEYQSPLTKHLNSNSNFIKIRKNIDGPFFAYINPELAPETLSQLISLYMPRMPQLSFSFSAIAASAEKYEKYFSGKTYALTKNQIFLENEKAYRALLLPFLPENFDVLIAGQNAASQLRKTKELLSAEQSAYIQTIVEKLLEEYAPGVSWKNDLEPLLRSEFAVSIHGSKILVVLELPTPNEEEKIKKIREVFKNLASRFAVETREIELPDSTKAKELVRKKEGPFTQIVFDAVAQNKWFISNDADMLERSVLLTKEPGRNFRDSQDYRAFLQPIMKNPELLGIARFPSNTFSFSKRTGSDHMETSFVFMLD